MWLRALLIAASVGAVYGLIGLEAASPLAIPFVIWIVGILLLSWRLPANRGTITVSAIGFVCGFGVVWFVVLGNLLSYCKPPSCETADPMTDVFTGLALVVPLIVLAGAEIGLREWLSARRPRTRR
jgi:hypothetical protein